MLLLTVAEAEMSIESIRKELAARDDLGVEALFKRIDEDGDGRISADELLQYMFDVGVNGDGTTEAIAAQIIGEYDSDQDGRLSYDEFVNMLLPSSAEELRLTCMKHAGLEPSKETSEMVATLLKAEKALAVEVIEHRKKLAEITTFEPFGAYEHLC